MWDNMIEIVNMNLLPHDIRSFLINLSSIKNINCDELLSVSLVHFRIIGSTIILLVDEDFNFEEAATKIPSNYVARGISDRFLIVVIVVGHVARFCFARRISSRDGGYEIATPLDRTRAPTCRISGHLLFCLSAPLLSGLLRWNFDESLPVRSVPRDSDVTRLLSVTKSS